MNLFRTERTATGGEEPLAARMRPRHLGEFVGQEEIVGPRTLLRNAIESDRLFSMILQGPPGSGKTTLAHIIARCTSAHFVQMSAVTSGVADVRRAIQEARQRRALDGQRTILFIDEIHRFNKAQQDALLPAVEDGTIILIGTTTENPYFEVTAPLLSRLRVFRLRSLTDQEIRCILERALSDRERGLGGRGIAVDEEAMAHIISVANGDARSALNTLEMAANAATPDSRGTRRIDLQLAVQAAQRRALLYDKRGEEHYNTVSAFIKSMRGGDPDAAVYWLARMLYAGEDPSFIARRILIAAAEEVGNADPRALMVAAAAAQAVEYVGLPEARIALAQAAIYVACAPKSNAAYRAIEEALRDVAERRTEEVPLHLRNPAFRGAKQLGYGKGYQYPHDHPGGHVQQEYFPPGARRAYYHPSDRGYERVLRERLRRWRQDQ